MFRCNWFWRLIHDGFPDDSRDLTRYDIISGRARLPEVHINEELLIVVPLTGENKFWKSLRLIVCKKYVNKKNRFLFWYTPIWSNAWIIPTLSGISEVGKSLIRHQISLTMWALWGAISLLIEFYENAIEYNSSTSVYPPFFLLYFHIKCFFFLCWFFWFSTYFSEIVMYWSYMSWANALCVSCQHVPLCEWLGCLGLDAKENMEIVY